MREGVLLIPTLLVGAMQEPWIEILSPKGAELFLERDHPPSVILHFQVHGIVMGEGRGEARVFLIPHAISYGGDAFRGREGLRATPSATIFDAEASLDLGELDLGLHQVTANTLATRSHAS